jgi:hypothetical protein
LQRLGPLFAIFQSWLRYAKLICNFKKSQEEEKLGPLRVDQLGFFWSPGLREGWAKEGVKDIDLLGEVWRNREGWAQKVLGKYKVPYCSLVESRLMPGSFANPQTGWV